MRVKFHKVIGCGGIGKGLLFHSQQNETLGRNESRLVHLSEARDYCKLQIVFYYIAMLLNGRADIYPIGAVGTDGIGDELIALLKQQEMETTYIDRNPKLPTMMSICIQYPDKEGCNITACNSAGGEVTPEFVADCMEKIGIDSRCALVAVPEIRVDSRVAFVKRGKAAGAFCAISIPVGEVMEFEAANIYCDCDLVAVNEEEARAMTGFTGAGEALAGKTLKYLRRWNPAVMLCMTMGAQGAYCGDESGLEYIAPYPSAVVNTTGAGDAFLGTVVSALALGFPFMKHGKKAGILCTAPELAAVCSGLAVESADSIPEEITKKYIREQLKRHQIKHDFLL